jgi:FMN-dependent NADH-azoreductase
LFAADIIVISASFYNFTIHSTLKAWINHITRPVKTFGYGEDGHPIDIVTEKNMLQWPQELFIQKTMVKTNDFVVSYLKAFLGFLGMTDLTVFRAEGVKVWE